MRGGVDEQRSGRARNRCSEGGRQESSFREVDGQRRPLSVLFFRPVPDCRTMVFSPRKEMRIYCEIDTGLWVHIAKPQEPNTDSSDNKDSRFPPDTLPEHLPPI